ncbi:putative amp dependent CoA ligase [Truncatella angustata]|uniref:Amp dependent CoA ligase n=1 Tax=Truncatella angustata TaxID=152316 RepID=A0A9P8ZVM0_9PEZI|nr:putative amp dependent CoA ligase [Truncatella angustata]KAH6652740.1 putative amp dependent CoA ligase [Truncatella angustata]
MLFTQHNTGGLTFVFDGPTLPLLLNLNTSQLLANKREDYKGNTALISKWQGSHLSYEALYSSTQDAAASLLNAGVRPGDRVLVLAGNTTEYVQLFFATGGVGAIFAIVNPTFSKAEILEAVEFLYPKVIVVAERIGYRKYHDLLEELIERKVHERSVIIQLGTTQPTLRDVLPWNKFFQSKMNISAELFDSYWGKAEPDDALCLQFTSGTTGPRKGALLTHNNLINNAYLVGHRLGFSSQDVLCCSPPLFHCFGLVCGVLAGIVVHGMTVVLPSEIFNAGESLQAISQNSCTVIHAVPTMFQAMLDYAQAKAYNTSNFLLRTGIIAGSSLSETLLQRLNAEFHLNGLAYAFGMTELSAVSFMTTPVSVSLLEDRSCVGTTLPHTSAVIVDEDMNALPPGSRGELLVSGYLVFKEYYRNPEKSKDAVVVDPQGRRWLRTGDIVQLSASGTAMVVGRLKDMIKRGGENIAPSDVESVLELHPQIAAAAVVGLPDEHWGETVCAFLQRNQNIGSLTPKESGNQVKVWLRKRMAPHKIPEHIIWLGEEEGVPSRFPVNVSGKVLKTELSAVAARLITRHR